MDDITLDQIDLDRLQDVVKKKQAEYAEALYAIGEEYDKALDQEQSADTDTRQAFCAGMAEAYKNALAILSGHKKGE